MAASCPNSAPKSDRTRFDRCTDDIHRKIVQGFYQHLLHWLQIMVTSYTDPVLKNWGQTLNLEPNFLVII